MTVRIGVLAAARIAESALIEPARLVDGVEVVAVAARDLAKAEDAAGRWHVPTAYGDYEALLADDNVDAIYIATPASLHRPWAVAALEAGKHLLCEKPLAANADDARRIADAAAANPDLVAMEAFHWRYHPFADRVIDAAHEVGDIERVESRFNLGASHIDRDDIRWDLAIGGGATMDLGCYPIQWVRSIMGDPTVVEATATCPVDGIDGRLRAELAWSTATGMVESSMIESADEPDVTLRVIGSEGEIIAVNPLAPHNGASLAVDGEVVERIEPGVTPTTYEYQLRAFRDAVVDEAPFPTTIADGVINMEVVDACYRAAGLDPRPAMT